MGKVSKYRLVLGASALGVLLISIGFFLFQNVSKNESKSVAISGLQIVVDENFSGTIIDFQNEPIKLSWNIANEDVFSGNAALENYQLEMTMGFQSYADRTEPLTHTFQLPFPPSTEKGFRQIEISKFSEYAEIYPFLQLANSRAGDEITFKLTLLGKNEENLNPLEAISETSVTWLRPQVKAPEKPIIEAEWNYLNSSEPCVVFRDKATHKFSAFPDSRASNLTTTWSLNNFVEKDKSEGKYHGYLGTDCVSYFVEKIKISATLRNADGESSSELEVQSKKPSM